MQRFLTVAGKHTHENKKITVRLEVLQVEAVAKPPLSGSLFDY